MYSQIILYCFLITASIEASIFESWKTPGEGRKRIIAPAEEIDLYRTPSRDSLVIKNLKVRKGAELKYDRALYRTLKPGLFVAERAGSFDGVVYGERKWQSFEYAKGDTIEYLQYEGEGYGIVRFRGQEISAELLSRKTVPFVQIRDPITELWIRVIDDKRLPLGWYRVDDDTVRKFQGGVFSTGPRRR